MNMSQICQMIKGVFKIGRNTAYNDAPDLPKVTVVYQGQELQAYSHLPYGFICHPTSNGVAFICAQNGQQANPVAIIGNSKQRGQRNLTQGEVGLENFLTGSFVLLRENGDIEVNSVRDVVVNAANNVSVNAGDSVNVVAANNITATCNTATLNAQTVTATAGSIGITSGSMSATIDSTGITVTGGDIVADGISLKTHVHSGVMTGGDNTGEPVTS